VPQLDSLAELVRVVDRTPEDYEMIAKESGAVMQTMADMTAAFHDAYFLDWDPGRRELFETTAEAIRIAHVEFENVASHHRTHMLHLKRNGRQLDELDDSIVRGRAGIEELRGRLKASATGKAKKKAPETQRLEQELEASEQRVRDKESAVAAHRTELREWDRACQLCRGDDLQKVLKLAKCERAIETMFRSLGGLSWIPTEVMTVRRTPVQAGLPH
jgi:hypothetical protein